MKTNMILKLSLLILITFMTLVKGNQGDVALFKEKLNGSLIRLSAYDVSSITTTTWYYLLYTYNK